jgi:2-polyprenyl-3-methyl-5-hydroxy-6-metoxy-1,4-benzoquinol methylase
MDAHRKLIDCNLCGSSDVSVVFEAGVAQASRIVKCEHCGLMYASPRAKLPDQDEIKDYDPDFTKRVQETSRDRYEKESFQVRDYEDTRADLRKAYPQRGKLLEIGCSMGFLLAKFREDGWQVEGIEPNRGYCEFIREHHGIAASSTILEDADRQDNNFDVVVMLHVIEHVPDPLGTLREIYRVLKPGGTLVLETPRYDSLMFRLLRHRERSVSCDGHIYFFTTATLREMAQKAGFTFEFVNYVGRSLNAARLLWNIGVMSKSRRAQAAIAKLSNIARLNTVPLRLNARDMQRMMLRKAIASE